MDLSKLHLCTNCNLRTECHQIVAGAGPYKHYMIVGAYPTREDDLFGLPFQGRNETVLNKLLKAADIPKSECYFTNVIKCAPKKASNIKKTNIEACKPWLWEEIQKVQPRLIVSLGRIPTILLLKLKQTAAIDLYIGNQINVPYMKIPVFPWYDLNVVWQSGANFQAQTIDFFRKVRQQYVGMDEEKAG